MQTLTAQERTIRDVLANKRYHIDYYQREYRWGAKHVQDMLNDLLAEFADLHKPANDRAEVEHYGKYFLGHIIVSQVSEGSFIIDGQQRLTTLTLLLIALHRRLKTTANVASLIYSERYAKETFNLDVPERTEALQALLDDRVYEPSQVSESVQNILDRFEDVEDFLSNMADDSIPFFADWLIDNVYLVQISASSDADAYTIFETENDRGLSLSNAEMLKGYLLTNITPERRESANELWRSTLRDINEPDKQEGSAAIQAWLRGCYAVTTSEHRAGGERGDFERIGGDFHRWVRESAEALHLKGSDSFSKFIERDFAFYMTKFLELRVASSQWTQQLTSVRHLAIHDFTLMYPVMLAPLNPDDSADIILRKWRVVGAYLDILLHRRIWNQRAITQDTMRSPMFLLVPEIRGNSVDELALALFERLDEDDLSFSPSTKFGLKQRNRKKVHRILARLTEFVELGIGEPSRFDEYLQTGRRGYDIEHHWSSNFGDHQEEYSAEQDFREERGLIGGLCLLPTSLNRSLQDKPYEEKLPKYLEQNILARSLHEVAHQNNPGFRRMKESSGLDFKPMAEFNRQELLTRQDLYAGIAGMVWSPDRIWREAEK